MTENCQRIHELQQTMVQSNDSYFDLEDLPDIPRLNKYTYSGISNSSSTDYILSATITYQKNSKCMKFLQTDLLIPSIDKMVDELKVRLQINTNLILYLLYLFKWNQEKLLEEYYTKGLFKKYQLKDYQLESSKKQNYGQCPVCLLQQELIKSDFCHHKYCRRCWQSYISQQLHFNQIFSNCLAQCNQTPILQSFIRKYVPSLKEIFLKKIGMSYCLLNKNISYCPNEKCSLFCQKPNQLTQKKVICPCGQTYCFQCRKQNHVPLLCEDVEKWKELINQESQCLQWIKKNTKTCPKCKMSVQKSIGCNKIKCLCGCQFCFQCSRKWDKIHLKSDQCPLNHKKIERKFSTEQKIFLKIYEETIQINKKMAKDLQSIEHCITTINDERVLQKLSQMKYDIKSAWLIHKYIKIGIYMLQRAPIENILQQDHLISIRQLVREIQKLRFGYKKWTERQQYSALDQLAQKKSKLEKCEGSYVQAWYSCEFY